MVPPSMLQSMHPYLYGLMNELIPRLNEIQHLGSQLSNHSSNLIQLCQTLCLPNPTPDQLQERLPGLDAAAAQPDRWPLLGRAGLDRKTARWPS